MYHNETFCWFAIVTVALSCIASGIKWDIGRKSQCFDTRLAFDALVMGRRFPSEYCHTVWCWKLEWCGPVATRLTIRIAVSTSTVSRFTFWISLLLRRTDGQTFWDSIYKTRADKSQDHSRALQACISPAPRNWRRRPGRPRHTWLRTVEEDLRQFNLGLASGLRRVQNRTAWRTLTGTATSPSSDWSPTQALTGHSVE